MISVFLFLSLFFLYSSAIPIAPEASSATINSIAVKFPPLSTSDDGAVMAYEINFRSLFNPQWQSVPDIGKSGNDMVEVQIVSIRVDAGKSISTGSFELGLEYSGNLAEDFEKPARTAAISWNATAAQFQAALAHLGAVTVKEVRKCDQFGGNTNIGRGGVNGWFYGCPYGSSGGYRWLVVFEQSAAAGIPTMFLYRSHLGSTYTGPGNQVSVTHIKRGYVSPSLCSDKICTQIVTGLTEGTPYSFRTRALTEFGGLTTFGPSSRFVSTLQNMIPSRPRPPVLSEATPSSLLLQIALPPGVQGVTSIESQYRLAQDVTQWIQGPSLAVALTQMKNNLILNIANLRPEISYHVRIRALNAVGYSPYSSVTEFTTTADAPSSTLISPPTILLPSDPQVGIVTTSIDVLVKSNAGSAVTYEPVIYLLQYRSEFESNYHTVLDTIVFKPLRQGVQVQEVSSRIAYVDELTSCSGFFWLRMGVVDTSNPTWSVTPPIAINASATEFAAAILSMGQVKALAPRVTVRRRVNTNNGFTWNVEIQGMGSAPPLQLHRHTFLAEQVTLTSFNSSLNPLPYIDPSNNRIRSYPKALLAANVKTDSYQRKQFGYGNVTTIFGSCWPANPNFPVMTQFLKSGDDTRLEEETVVRIPNVQYDTGYFVRVQWVTAEGRIISSSNDSYTRTPSRSQLIVPPRPADPNALSTWLSRMEPGVPSGPAFTAPGLGAAPARQEDPHYLPGVGMGGQTGEGGGNGHCVIITYNPLLLQPFDTKRFFYTGTAQTYTVPANTAVSGHITLVTIKCWGSGGGGGKITDLNFEASNVASFSNGGGGGFAQVTVAVEALDVIEIIVGGGGQTNNGEKGGAGGFGGGGRGGDGLLGGGGGGGGGASSATRTGFLLLIAAGGAGGGSTDYCCAHGGAGGSALGGSNGTSPTDNTPWPLSSANRPTSVVRRFEYTAAACPIEINLGDFCISVWDLLPQSLPAEHVNLQYGRTPGANYSLWASGGSGACNLTGGGMPGTSGSFAVRVGGVKADFIIGVKAVFAQAKGYEHLAQGGYYLRGGNGGEGKEGGGGGGGGLWGGGGGGSGIDAGGGGGGNSFANASASFQKPPTSQNVFVPTPRLVFVNDTAVTFNWTLNWASSLWGAASRYIIEISYGPWSQDFTTLGSVEIAIPGPPSRQSSSAVSGAYTVANLTPESFYNFRVIPSFTKGLGAASSALQVQTLASARNYWEPVVPRRLALSASGRGFSDPVLSRPHLVAGVEVFGSRVNFSSVGEREHWFSDAPTAETPVMPSGRRGHSMSTIDGNIYIFGGLTSGYDCASVYKDITDMGTTDAGLNTNPCATFQGEVNELWAMDVHTYVWTLINTTQWGSPPPPQREQHTAVTALGDLFVFGGKTRTYGASADGLPALAYPRDHLYNDLWRLSIQHAQPLHANWTGRVPLQKTPLAIPQDKRLFIPITIGNASGADLGDGVSARNGMCIDKVIVRVQLTHDCMNQIRISLMGPGPLSGSPNFHSPSAAHEIILFNQRSTNGTGCVGGVQTMTFDDAATHNTFQCCDQDFDGHFKPESRLSEFISASPVAVWTLVVQDMNFDSLTGAVESWGLDFEVSPCVKSYQWTKVTGVQGTRPPPRYKAKAVVHGSSIFIYGGRDVNDTALDDLYRFDVATSTWTALTPVNFNLALDTASAVGANFLMTSWGLLRFGGYYRQPTMLATGDSYVNDVYLQDPVTLRWRQVQVDMWPMSDSSVGAARPAIRYLAAAAFVPARELAWATSFGYRGLFDQVIPSTYTNFAGALADSVLVFGGTDGSENDFRTNITAGAEAGYLAQGLGGSSRGLMKDLWMLRLANWSTDGARSAQQAYLNANCRWRSSPSAALVSDPYECLTATTGGNCEFRSLLILAWCSNSNQTIA